MKKILKRILYFLCSDVAMLVMMLALIAFLVLQTILPVKGGNKEEAKEIPSSAQWTTYFPTPKPEPIEINYKGKTEFFQLWLHAIYEEEIELDGMIGKNSKKIIVKALQIELNKLGENLEVDGVYGVKTRKALSAHSVKPGDNGNIVRLVQGLLYSFEYNVNGFDGANGTKCVKAIKLFQEKNKLNIDGVVGQATFAKLIGEPINLEPKSSNGASGSYLGLFRATSYCPCFSCSEGYGRSTSSGAVATQGRTIAVDPKVIPIGTWVYVEFPGSFSRYNGQYRAEDVGGSVKGKHIDVFFDKCGQLGSIPVKVYKV